MNFKYSFFKQGLGAVNAGSAMSIKANVSCQTANLDDFDAADSLQLPAKKLNVRSLKYSKGDVDPVPCQGCVDSNKTCYEVAQSNVSVCWECKVSGRKCTNSKRRKGMFIISSTHFLLIELYR